MDESVDLFNILSEDEIYLPTISSFQTVATSIPSFQYADTSLTMELGNDNISGAFADHKGYFTTFGAELDLIAKMENLVAIGADFISILYSYRSVSQAIPEVSIDIPSDATPTEEQEYNSKRIEINRKIVEILRPEMLKIKELMLFVAEVVGAFHSSIQHLANRDANKELIPDTIHLSLVKLLDVLVKLDNLKDIKSCLLKDFSRYKRAAGPSPSIEILEEQSQLQSFLSSPDPRKSKNYIILSLRDEIKRITGHENVLIDTIESVLDSLDNIFYLLPDEKFRLMRVLPYLLLIVDGEPEDTKGFNVFKTTKLKIQTIQKLFKKSPVVPLHGDMCLTLEFILAKSSHYDRNSMGLAWGREPDVKTIAQYNIRSHWETIRESYTQYLNRFALTMNRIERGHTPFKKVLEEDSVELANEVFTMVSEGFQKLAKWNMLIQQMMAWKYTHPASASSIGSSNPSEQNITATANAYALVLKYNLSAAEISVLIDVISMIKTLSSELIKAEAVLSPYIRFHVHHKVQQLVQGDLLPLLHRVDKRNNPILPSLLKIRSIAADWINGEEPRRDYKNYSRKKGAIFAAHPARVIGTASTQLFILRTQINSLYDTRSEVRRKNSIFGKSDLEKNDIDLFIQFNIDSFYFPYLLNFSSTLRQISDLSDLWYREFFLEMTKSIQFPIDMSVPWILAEHLLLNNVTNAPMIEKVFFILDIYNDAAHRALYSLNQQYFYDEIEAEANLVVDQMYFILSEEIYNHYKNMSASSLLEKSFKNKLEELRGSSDYLTVEARRFESLLTQKHIQLLGRSINFSFILTQNINNKIVRDLDVAIKRFESSDVRGIIELKHLIDVIQDTYNRLSQFLELDPFDSILSEVNESYAPATFRGRISLHFLTSIVQDIFPNFSYNWYTQRFISSSIAIRPYEYSRAPKSSSIHQAIGSVCGRAYETLGKLTRGFFGSVHINAYLSLGISYTDLTMLIDQCMKNMNDKMRDLSDYLDALKESIPPTKFPPYVFQSVGSYGYYEGKLRALLAYDDLKPEVFQLFRELGNTIAFLRDLSQELEISDEFDFLIIAPLLGMTPDYPKANDTSSNVTIPPVKVVMNHVVEELQGAATLNASPSRLSLEVVKSNEVVENLPKRMDQLVTFMAKQFSGGLQMDPSTNLETHSSSIERKSLFRWVLNQIEEYMFQHNLTSDWAMSWSNRPTSTAAASNQSLFVDFDNSPGFCRLWSALNFLFCISENESDDEVNRKEPVKKSTSMANSKAGKVADGDENENDEDMDGNSMDSPQFVSNEAEFGHGFTVAGSVFLHLLGQKSVSELTDFSLYVMKVHSYEQKLIPKHSSPANNNDGTHPTSTQSPRNVAQVIAAQSVLAAADPSLVRDTNLFINNAQNQRKVQVGILSMLEAHYTPRESYQISSVNRLVFHPPNKT